MGRKAPKIVNEVLGDINILYLGIQQIENLSKSNPFAEVSFFQQRLSYKAAWRQYRMTSTFRFLSSGLTNQNFIILPVKGKKIQPLKL